MFKYRLIPWSHKQHGLALEMLNIIISKLLIVVVFEDLKPVGGLELAIIQGLEGDGVDGMDE